MGMRVIYHMSCGPEETGSLPSQGDEAHTVHIKMAEKTTKLTNKKLQKKMDYIAMMEEVIDKERLDWLGNIARQTNENSQIDFLLLGGY
jgi:hypothetical protein